MSFAVVTFGCRVNLADSQAFDVRLRSEWGGPAPLESADLVLVNTCAVTAGAERGARQAIRRVARTNPRARIVVTGCYATRDAAGIAGLPGVCEVWRNDEKDRRLSGTPAGSGAAPPGFAGRSLPHGSGRTVRFLRVHTGCDQACAYCAIPATRGRPRSVEPDAVASAVERAVSTGSREIVIAGIHLGAYGRDLAPTSSLVALARRLDDGDDGTRLRLSAIEPADCDGELIGLVAASRRFVPHFHLPLQSGSDRVLERMRRPGTVGAWQRLVREVRRAVPQAAVGTDLIAGFPGETEDDFRATLDAATGSGLAYLHVFPYSDRPGTAAASMPGKIPPPVIRRRVAMLREAGERLRRQFEQAQVGTVRDALTLRDPTVALTDNFLKLRIPAGRAANERVAVRITGTGRLAGVVVG